LPQNTYTAAFNQIIPIWQEFRHQPAAGLKAVQHEREIGGGHASHTGSTAVVRPNISDFIADVELNARRALSFRELAHFLAFYRDQDGQLDSNGEPEGLPADMKPLDMSVRTKLGRRMIAVGLHPLGLYFRGVDVRDRRRANEHSIVVDLNASPESHARLFLFADAREPDAFDPADTNAAFAEFFQLAA
jgi:hypothetical protein